jgi:hypothetical protein
MKQRQIQKGRNGKAIVFPPVPFKQYKNMEPRKRTGPWLRKRNPDGTLAR